ncbi:hypothetical protein NL676_013408 [Syzygium grande]|nr:hypothetical protein NL676_013408 [Syzygium grande]
MAWPRWTGDEVGGVLAEGKCYSADSWQAPHGEGQRGTRVEKYGEISGFLLGYSDEIPGFLLRHSIEKYGEIFGFSSDT